MIAGDTQGEKVQVSVSELNSISWRVLVQAENAEVFRCHIWLSLLVSVWQEQAKDACCVGLEVEEVVLVDGIGVIPS